MSHRVDSGKPRERRHEELVVEREDAMRRNLSILLGALVVLTSAGTPITAAPAKIAAQSASGMKSRFVGAWKLIKIGRAHV